LLLQSSAARGFEVLAYCFMPDHVHLLLQGTSSDSDLRSLVTLWKQRSAYAHRQTTGAALWQSSFHDRVLRSDEGVRTAAAYIVANPLRAGLVDDLHAYPFWGSSRWSRADLIESVRAFPGRAG
jgi:putative transposase